MIKLWLPAPRKHRPLALDLIRRHGFTLDIWHTREADHPYTLWVPALDYVVGYARTKACAEKVQRRWNRSLTYFAKLAFVKTQPETIKTRIKELEK